MKNEETTFSVNNLKKRVFAPHFWGQRTIPIACLPEGQLLQVQCCLNSRVELRHMWRCHLCLWSWPGFRESPVTSHRSLRTPMPGSLYPEVSYSQQVMSCWWTATHRGLHFLCQLHFRLVNFNRRVIPWVASLLTVCPFLLIKVDVGRREAHSRA